PTAISVIFISADAYDRVAQEAFVVAPGMVLGVVEPAALPAEPRAPHDQRRGLQQVAQLRGRRGPARAPPAILVSGAQLLQLLLRAPQPLVAPYDSGEVPHQLPNPPAVRLDLREVRRGRVRTGPPLGACDPLAPDPQRGLDEA